DRLRRCPLSEVKRTFGATAAMSANDPKRTFPGPESRVAAVCCCTGGMLFFRLEARAAQDSETPRVHYAAQRCDFCIHRQPARRLPKCPRPPGGQNERHAITQQPVEI